MATTAYGVNHPMAVKLWSKALVTEALKETYVSRFMGKSNDSLIVVKDELNKSKGDRVRIGLRMQLTAEGVIGDGTLEGSEEALTIYQDDLLIDQHRHAVRSAGKMTEQRVHHDIRDEAKDGLKDWWANNIDRAFFNQVTGNTSVSQTLAGMNLPLAPTGTASPSNAHIIYGSGTTSTTTSLTASSTASASVRGLLMTPGVIDVALNLAKIAVPTMRPLRINGQDKWVMFLHPNQVRSLRTNAAAGAVTWYDLMRARVEGGERDNPLYNGGLGEYNGVILHESSRIPDYAASGNTTFRRGVLCGAQAAAFGTGRDHGGEKMSWFEELFDYGNQLGVEAGMIWGLKKLQFNAQDFGTMVCVTYAPNP